MLLDRMSESPHRLNGREKRKMLAFTWTNGMLCVTCTRHTCKFSPSKLKNYKFFLVCHAPATGRRSNENNKNFSPIYCHFPIAKHTTPTQWSVSFRFFFHFDFCFTFLHFMRTKRTMESLSFLMAARICR